MALETPITLKGKLVWSGLILFVAGWMFVLGIMVGRGTTPIPQVNQSIEEKLAQFKATQSDPAQENPQSPADQEPGIPVTELKFYEKLKETQPITPPKKVSPKPLVSKKKATQQPAKSASNTPPAVKTSPPKPKPTPTPTKTAKTPQPKPEIRAQKSPPPAKERFTIQVAAVKQSPSAEKLVLDLRQKGFDAYQIRSQSEKGTVWYRVRVGAFQNQSEAQSVLARLSKIKINGMVLRTP